MTEIVETADRLLRLAKRRSDEGIYTDAALCEKAAEVLSAVPERQGDGVREALQQVRDLFIVDYGPDPKSRPSIGYDSEALPKVIAILDAALSRPSGEDAGEVERPASVQAAFEVFAGRPDTGPHATAMFRYIEQLEAALRSPSVEKEG